MANTNLAEVYIENYVSYPAFHIFSHLAAVDDRVLDDVTRAHVLAEIYWLMRMFVSVEDLYGDYVDPNIIQMRNPVAEPYSPLLEGVKTANATLSGTCGWQTSAPHPSYSIGSKMQMVSRVLAKT